MLNERTHVLAELAAAGVSIWLDDLSRERLVTGNLAALVDKQHIRGVTTNPSIFKASLSAGSAYLEQIRDLAMVGADAATAARALTTADVRAACDVLMPVHDKTEGRDGFVSIEVDPRSADDVASTVAEAKLLAWMVDRPNVMIKIPATRSGLKSIVEVLAGGISVNVTLIFSLDRYREVTNAFMEGLERAVENGHDLTRIASVASFFISRVDTEIDRLLEKVGRNDLCGRAALANARLAYESYEDMLGSARWAALKLAGAKPQRPLWASTGVKNPTYDDTRYVTGLVAADCVNTMPESTLLAVQDHGVVRGDTITGTYGEAAQLFDDLRSIGIDYDDVFRRLESAGVAQFESAWSELVATLADQLLLARKEQTST
jgi:transaldolase